MVVSQGVLFNNLKFCHKVGRRAWGRGMFKSFEKQRRSFYGKRITRSVF